MSARSWEPWLSELEGAVDAGDGARLWAGLESLERFSLHEHRGRQRRQWDRLFALLLRLLGHGEASVRHRAYHDVFVVMWLERGPKRSEQAREDSARQGARRTAQLLPALEPLVRSGAVSLLDCTDDLAHTEGLVALGPQEIYEHWIASLADDMPLALAARIAYLAGRAPWESAGESLTGLLDHADHMVRAYAARALGRRYAEGEGELAPPLSEVVAMLTARELERPGIAGPFFSNWYDPVGGLEEFERHSGVNIDEWFCTILARRKQDEPDTLPCSNGIDFFAHEIFGGRPSYVRKLLDMGHEMLAVQAATEVQERIDGMEPILVELGDRASAEVCRQAAWHLAYYYRLLHPAGERRGFVTRRTLSLPGADLFVNLSPLPGDAGGRSYAYSGVLYPRLGETFDEATAEASLELVLPRSMRGELVPYGMPGYDEEPGLYLRERSAHARYQYGALVAYHGDLAAKRWEWIRIIWHGPAGAWRPEAMG
ncbi:MAG TPA: hypothetical protein VJA16_17065 [Thermoanaerobaculia bacterium]